MDDITRFTPPVEEDFDFLTVFSQDVISRGKALLERETLVYGGPTVKSLAENIAFNFICKTADVSWPMKPVDAQTYAAVKLMALALVLANAPASPEIIAEAVRDLGVLGRRMANAAEMGLDRTVAVMPAAREPEQQQPQQQIPFAPRTAEQAAQPQLKATDPDLDGAGSQAYQLLRNLEHNLQRA
jgi:hypothetical protein